MKVTTHDRPGSAEPGGRRNPLKRVALVAVVIVLSWTALAAEGLTLYFGKASTQTQYYGVSIGGDIWDFLQLQFDVMKYAKQDPALRNDDPALSRGDWMGASFNIALKLPLHLIPSLDRLEFIQPYILTGFGYGLESFAADYLERTAPNGKSGLFNWLRPYRALGVGVIVMLSPTVGVKLDYRTLTLNEQADLLLPGRSFNRLSVGICFGPYKTNVPKIKK
jgi:hypothetical protein